MPPRSRRPEQMATFELVPDDEREDADGPLGPEGEEKAGPTLRERAATRWRRLSRRGRVLVATGSAVVVLAAATAAVAPGLLDARDQRLRAEAVQGLPGVVGDLSEPLTNTWEVPVGDDGTFVMLSGGVLVTTDGTEAVATSVANGGALWRQEVGATPTCGPDPGFSTGWADPPDLAVCLGGEPGRRAATVLDSAGQVLGTRELGEVNDPMVQWSSHAPTVWPGPDGTLAVVEDAPLVTVPAAEDRTAGETLRALRDAGWRDPTLRVQDVATGDLVAGATARLRASDVAGCGTFQEDGHAEPQVQPFPYLDTSSTRSVLHVCNVAVGITADGDVLDLTSTDGASQPLPGGGSVVLGESSRFLDAAGAEIVTVPGWAVPPTIDDDGGAFISVVPGAGSDLEHATLVATSRGGERLWSRPSDGFSVVAARLAGTVVVADAHGIVGLDADTGSVRWDAGELVDVAPDGTGDQVVGAVTDGTRVLLGIGGENRPHRLIALDARDGGVAWQQEVSGALGRLVAADGHPVVVSASWQSVRGFG
ncbi:hypothetical protein ACQFYA_04890 [Promicromonospora sp. Marseille-Q5078]